MTTITFRDGVMCADSMSISDGLVMGSVKKIWSFPDALVAVTGPWADGLRFFDWWPRRETSDPPKMYPDSQLQALVAFRGAHSDPRPQLVWYGADCLPMPYDGDELEFMAIGGGEHIAVGAMEAGASALEACRIACKRHVQSGPPIWVHHVDGRPAMKTGLSND